MLLSRLKAEFSRQEKRISHRVRGWDELKFVPRLPDKDIDLRSNALEWIRQEPETIEEHLRLARDCHLRVYRTLGLRLTTAPHPRAATWLDAPSQGLSDPVAA